MPKSVLEEHLSTIACPLCGAQDFAVVKPAQYPPGISVEEFEKAFQASSDHQLIDQLVRCKSCSLVYINPRVDESILLSGYSDAVDPDFVSQNPDRIKTFHRTLERILRRLQIPAASGRGILDVGCAGGAFLVAARDCGLKPVGIEPSHWLANYGRTTYGLDVRQGILAPGVFPDSSFDLVSLWDVIEHVANPDGLLRTIHNVLTPKGTLVVNYPDYGSAAARLMGSKWPFLLSVHLLYYTRATITEQLRRAGFEVLEIRPHFQTLPLGYLLRRATPYLGIAAYARRMVEAVGMANHSVSYNMGQTLVLARRVQ